MDLSDALGSGAQNGQNSGGGMWPGQPAQPVWPGQPSQPAWPGQPSQPAWPGQPNQPSQPAWPGQPSQPSQPAWPGQPSQPTAPSWPSNPGQHPPSAPQQVPLTVPYHLLLPRGVYDKMLITINGVIKAHAKKFTINLSRGSEIALHFNPRFNENGKKVIVRNSKLREQWGKEERELGNFPFHEGQPFEVKILCTGHEYRVAVNKSHVLEFKHRMRELSSINSLSIFDDVTLSSVNVETLP
ncbi:hypothetical protein AGOR_G00108000 [Albula goreensis]|uniref:Galectin n=1 Tax=Albula goreensis TaxID=1534307 RepID=A0A8T3DDR0_9TELE|nr:hypothetical protein AGOR_G00108000 [Albula goreensis]